MPTAGERAYYRMGVKDGFEMARGMKGPGLFDTPNPATYIAGPAMEGIPAPRRKPKRKLSAWNKFVKANSKKKIYQFANGKLKLKKMGIAFRKTRAGKKSRR
jgi:hypothetical protein